MKLVVFGLSISSAWGNGHATLWRGLCNALARRGHRVVFYERDVPYYARHRDLTELPAGKLVLYSDWDSVVPAAEKDIADAEVAMVTSYCPDGIAATDLVMNWASGLTVFYDLDTPVTLLNLKEGKPVPYIGPRGLRDFDLVLSYTGGEALKQMRTVLGARRVATLYGSVDPQVHRPAPPSHLYGCDLSYLGTYAEDRQATLANLFIEPARRLSEKKFLIGGAQYPSQFPWEPNIHFVQHVPPPEHPAFYSSSKLTLNITRGAMAQMGYCPSGRLFEAAACGVPILTDWWEGLGDFFAPGREILVARTPEESVSAINLETAELEKIARAARERALSEHTADARVVDLETALASCSEPLCDEPPVKDREGLISR